MKLARFPCRKLSPFRSKGDGPLEYDEVIGRLEEMGDERARKVWARVGMETKNYFGVNLTKLKKFSRPDQ